jgi:hypothetical protein
MKLKYPAMLVNPAQFSKDLFNRFVIDNEMSHGLNYRTVEKVKIH